MPVEYVPYTPTPVDGQAVLNNLTRTRRLLTYRAADGAERRIARGLPLYDVVATETVGDAEPFTDEAGNLLLSGSCLTACAYLKDQGVSVDLVYIDPPFASGADYAKTIYLRRNPHADADAQAGTSVDDGTAGFEEAMYGDIWTKEAYLDWMYENLVAIKAVMKPTATVYVHLDWHVVHYVKVLMDEVFGESSFQNHIVWKRQTSSGLKGRTSMGKNHDDILVYSMSPGSLYNLQYTPYTDEYIEEQFKHTEEDGRKFKDAFLGVDPSDERVEELRKEGRLFKTKSGGLRKKVYLEDAPGVPLDDVWADVPAVNSQASERLDYPTQKPEALLERIIRASSDEGMLVADFFGGSGTTARAAHTLGRRFVTSDVGLNSLQTARDSLRDAGATFTVAEVRDGVSLFRNPVQTMSRLASLVPGLAEGGVPSPWFGHITDPRLGPVPVFLPNLVDTNSRVLDVPALNRVLTTLPELDDATQKVIVYYVDVLDLGELDAFVADTTPDATIEVELRDLKEVLTEAVMEDHVEASVEETDGAFVVTIDRFVSDRLIQAIEAFNQKAGLPRQASLLDGTPEADRVAEFQKKGGLTLSDEGLEGVEAVFVDATNADGEWHTDAEVRIDKKSRVVRDGEQTKSRWDGTVRLDAEPLRVKVRSVLGDETVVAVADFV